MYNKSDVQGHSLSYSFVCKLIIHEKVPCALFYFLKSCKVVFEKDIALLPNKYNYTTLNSQFSYRNLCKIFQLKPDYYYEESEVKECKKNAVVYHALGNFGVQTWHAEGTHPFGKLWDEYMMQSPWKDYHKEPAQLTVINRWQKRLYAVLPHFLYNPIHRIAVEVSLDQREKIYRKDA
uniref:Uncharacterized protein n=1 Tax=Eubacterium plexicaudatum ASF492 TaxID=1235802 RepID=N2AEW6_9FIRM